MYIVGTQWNILGIELKSKHKIGLCFHLVERACLVCSRPWIWPPHYKGARKSIYVSCLPGTDSLNERYFMQRVSFVYLTKFHGAELSICSIPFSLLKPFKFIFHSPIGENLETFNFTGAQTVAGINTISHRVAYSRPLLL